MKKITKPFIIAEIGINHCGKISFAKKLINHAVKAGADAVKFQTFITDKLIKKDEPLMPYQKRNIKDNINQEGIITVSNKFYPSASFLDVSADAVIDIIKKPPGLYLVNSNPRYSLYEILQLLKDKFKLDITIQKDDTFQRNDLMIDHEVKVQSL